MMQPAYLNCVFHLHYETYYKELAYGQQKIYLFQKVQQHFVGMLSVDNNKINLRNINSEALKNTRFMVELDNCIIIIKNVPSQVCKQCGEVSYSDEVAKQLEKLVNRVRDSITEITVINYSEKVA